MRRIMVFLLIVSALAFLFACGGKANNETVSETTEETDMFGKNKGAVTDTVEVIRPSCVLVIEAGERIFYAHFEDNPSAAAFRDKLNSEALTVDMSDFGGFEKVGDLPWDLPSSDSLITTKPGDLILYQGNKISLYYGENTYGLTKLAYIGSTTGEELLDALGEGDVSVTFSLEWGE